VPDCGWIWEPLTGGGGSQDATDLAKTSRAGRVTRVIRVIRLIRLIRIVKLYKQAKLAQKKAQGLNLQNPKRFLQRKSHIGSISGVPGQNPNEKHPQQKIHPMKEEKPLSKDDSLEMEMKKIDKEDHIKKVTDAQKANENTGVPAQKAKAIAAAINNNQI
jgi:hypothetical protein